MDRDMHRTALTNGLKPFWVMLLMVSFGSVLAQSEEDALRASTVLPGGTARSIGLANAFGALGADGACIGINPGGFALYRTSEISLSPGLEVNDVSSTYYGNTAADTKTRFFFSNLALVLNSPRKTGSDWRSTTFGVVFDRQATNNWGRQAMAERVGTSILDDFAFRANGSLTTEVYDNHPFDAGLAYDAYAIDPADPSDTLGTSYVAVLPAGAAVQQTHTIDSKGSTSNTSFFYSANYLDKLYIGASIGIIGHRYTSATIHTERPVDEGINLKDVTYKQNLGTTGNGLDVKLGVIMRFTDRVRAGVAFHSPMWMQLNDVYTTEVITNFNSAPDGATSRNFSAVSPDGAFNYRVLTPWRTVLSAAYVAGSHGLFSVDYTYADYSNARLRSSNKLVDPYDFAAENRVINNVFRPVHSVRVGTEWRKGNWYFRMGWGFVPDPYTKDDLRHGLAQKTYAGGLGFRGEHFGLDLGLNYITSTTKYFQYDPAIVNTTSEDRATVRSLVTFSFRP